VDSTAAFTCSKGMVLPRFQSSCRKHPRLEALWPAGDLFPKLRFNFRRQGPQQNLEREHCLLRRLDKCAAWKELRTTWPEQHHCQHPHELSTFQPTEHAQRNRWLFSTRRVMAWVSEGVEALGQNRAAVSLSTGQQFDQLSDEFAKLCAAQRARSTRIRCLAVERGPDVFLQCESHPLIAEKASVLRTQHRQRDSAAAKRRLISALRALTVGGRP
jgi:hypothetical protein